MATEDQVTQLRQLVNEPDSTNYSDDQLAAVLDASTSINAAASRIWAEKTAGLANMIDVQEGSSNRKLSQLRTNAMEMTKYFDGLVAGEQAPPTARRSGSREIERI